MSANSTQAKLTTRHQTRGGQVVTEYLMILTFVVLLLTAAKVKIGGGDAMVCPETDATCKSGGLTVMEHMSKSFTIWMKDIFIIISFPS